MTGTNLNSAPRNRSLVTGMACVFGARVGGVAVSFLTAVVLARGLGPAGRGLFAVAYLLPSFSVLLLNAGLGPANIYHGSRSTHPQSIVIGNGLILSAFLSALAVVGALSVFYLWGEFLPELLPPAVAWGAIAMIPGMLFYQHHRGHLLVAGSTAEYSALEFSQILLQFCAVGLFLLIFPADVPWAVAGMTVGFTVIGFATVFLAVRKAGSLDLRLHPSYVGESLKYGLGVWQAEVIAFLNYRVDILLLALLSSDNSVGLYAVAVGIVEKLWLLSKSAATVLFPALSRDDCVQRGGTALAARLMMCMSFVMAVALFFGIPLLVHILFGPAYADCVQALRPLLVGVVLHSASRILAVDIASRGKPSLNGRVAFVGLIVNIALNLLWIPSHGITGAAWASSCSYGTILLFRLPVYQHLSGIPWHTALVPQFSDIRLLHHELEQQLKKAKAWAPTWGIGHR